MDEREGLETLVEHKGAIGCFHLVHPQDDPEVTFTITLPDSAKTLVKGSIPVSGDLLNLIDALQESTPTFDVQNVRIQHDEHWVVLSTPMETILHWLKSCEFVEVLLNESHHYFLDLNDGILRTRANKYFRSHHYHDAIRLYQCALKYFPESSDLPEPFDADVAMMRLAQLRIRNNCALAYLRIEDLKRAIRFSFGILKDSTELQQRIAERREELKPILLEQRKAEVARVVSEETPSASSSDDEDSKEEVEDDELETAEIALNAMGRKCLYLQARGFFQLGMKYNKAVDVAMSRKAGGMSGSSWKDQLKQSLTGRGDEDADDSDTDEETAMAMGIGRKTSRSRRPGGQLVDPRYVVDTNVLEDQMILLEKEIVADTKISPKKVMISLLGEDEEEEEGEDVIQAQKDQDRMQAMSLALLRKACIAFSRVEATHKMAEQGSAEFDAALNIFHIYGRRPPCCCACREVCDELVKSTVLPVSLGLEKRRSDDEENWDPLLVDTFFFFCPSCEDKMTGCLERFRTDIWDVHLETPSAAIQVTTQDTYLRRLACYWFLRAVFQMNIYLPMLDLTGRFIRNAVWSIRQRIFPKKLETWKKLDLYLLGEPEICTTRAQVLFNEGPAEDKKDSFLFLKVGDLFVVAVVSAGFDSPKRWPDYALLPASQERWSLKRLEERICPDPLLGALRAMGESL